MKTNKILNLSLLVILLAGSCKKDNNNMQVIDEKKEVLSYIKSLGFSESSIIDIGNEYVVEGDISFPKNMKIPVNKSLKVEAPLILQDKLMSTLPAIGDSKISQTYTGNLVNADNRINVRIFIDPSITNLTNEINAAIGLWNSVTQAGIFFSIVSGAAYDILIVNEAISGYGLARSPLNGSAGNLVRINTQSMINDGLNPNQMSTVIAHEFGHCIGFRHTDWLQVGESSYGVDDVGTAVNAIEVPNAGGTDVNSIMNSGPNNTLAGVLSNKDAVALWNLYPKISWTIIGPNTIWRGVEYEYWGSNTNGVTFTWTVPSSIGTITSGQGTNHITIETITTGTQLINSNIKLKVVDSNGFSSILSHAITLKSGR
ncbi:hypothetical protein EZ456_20615 [Pedobacter psychrodurus]|uniref:Dual-action HEIGH metallo-peptidase n=1 Tax=Pedobacter psychrodurus TaxID=2530456 RepID=A0A4R0PIA5_9SPHI|nr:M57 family metalloprotease [Pedobacter psychrodurus]TCD19368.1 hypothetical protein EZ456_20615 [Pedobacter psychrodurus]